MKNFKSINITVVVLFVATMGLVSSCKKKDDNPSPTPTNNFSISVTSPTDMQTFTNGSTVNIKATISNSTEMHGYDLKITNKSNNNQEVFKKEAHEHATSYTIDESWLNNVTMHSDMELEITVYVDHEGNTKTQHVHFHCHP